MVPHVPGGFQTWILLSTRNVAGVEVRRFSQAKLDGWLAGWRYDLDLELGQNFLSSEVLFESAKGATY
jgi:hypothetical protein